MSNYAKLGTLSVRFLAVGFFVLAFVSLFVGFAGPMAMGSMMMGAGYQQNMPRWGQMMQGGMGFWWGPTVGNLLLSGILFSLSAPIGKAMASGLED